MLMQIVNTIAKGMVNVALGTFTRSARRLNKR